MVASQKALHPRYAEKFKCIGSACEDTCCRSWQIPIDRATFDKYRALPDGPLTPVFEASLVLRIQPASTLPNSAESNRDLAPAVQGTQAFYGQINLLPDDACPFLSAESLCRIQADLGKDYLSHVCNTFPRVSRTVDSRSETSLLLSCPEAARQVLLDRNFMHLPRTAPSGYARYTPFLVIAAALDPPHGNPFQYLMEIRHLLFLIVKDRSYPLWQRLFIIGLFSKRLTDIQADARDTSARDTTPALLCAYGELMQQGRLRSTMDGIPAHPETQLSIILKLLDARGVVGPIPPRLLECFQAFMTGITFNAKHSILEISRSYKQVYMNWLEPFMARNDHLFENYLLCYILRNRFPFGDYCLSDACTTTPLQEFALMALRYSFLNALATGMAGQYRESFHVDHVVKLVQSFTKSFEHIRGIQETMLGLVSEHKLATSSGMAMLLRI